MRLTSAFLLAAVLSLGACATTAKPELVAGQPDTIKLKVYWPGIGGTEAAIEKAVAGDLEAYRVAHGYRTYAVLDKRFNMAPTYLEYTARFEK